jgi:hypothetical protein
VQAQLEKLIEKNYYLNKSAKDAYRQHRSTQRTTHHALRSFAAPAFIPLSRSGKFRRILLRVTMVVWRDDSMRAVRTSTHTQRTR